MSLTPDTPTSTLTSWQAGDPSLMLVSAEAEVRSYCGWHIWPVKTNDVVTTNGSGSPTLPLPTLHLTAVSTVTETTVDSSNTATTTTLVEGTDYDWSEAGYLTRNGYGSSSVWTWKLRGVSATITHGYDQCPPEVQAVVLALASRSQESGGIDQAGPFRFSPSKNEDGSTGGTMLSKLEKAILDRYRIPAQP